MRGALAALLAAALLAGCGTTSSATNFSGAEQGVAEQVEALQPAGEARDGEEVCGQILSEELRTAVQAGRSSCAEQVEEAIADADDFDLEVRDVTVTGDQARARVQQGDDGRTATFEFARESGGWRATSLGTG